MLKAKSASDLISRHISVSRSQLNPNPNQQFLPQKLLLLLKQSKSTKCVQQIHTQMLINSIPKLNFILSKIIDLKNFPYASLLFSRMPDPDDYAFNVMIRGLTTTWNNHSLALQLYYRMKFSGLKPNNFTFPFLFIACANLLELGHGKAGHCSVMKIGLGSDSHTMHSLISFYSRCGELGSARKVFDEIPERDSVSWNSMISGYLKMGCASEAVSLFGKMIDDGFRPDETSLVSTLSACGELGDLSLGKRILVYALKSKMELSTFLGSALVGMFGKCGDLWSARRIFDGMLSKDVVAWNALITGLAQNGMSNEAINLFHAMKEAGGVKPDVTTLASVLPACASIGALDLGKWIETYASERGLLQNIFVSTALLDMYAKCGSLDDALRVFEVMPAKNEVSWNAMISALAFHGRAQEALSLFQRMSREGASNPNEVTFVGLLSACVHAGLVDEGQRLFQLMISSFGLTPKIEHYSCMVDLLARAGRVYEAWDFVEKMPGKPDEIILSALLGACQKHKNIDVGERVMQQLLDLQPSNSGNYVISSKIYANLNRWDESAKMRLLMRQRGVSKTPGCSWVEIEAQLHEFHAGKEDLQHAVGIHEVLGLLIEEMKREGYVPDVNSV